VAITDVESTPAQRQSDDQGDWSEQRRRLL
jgi:hypothetical protein